MIVDEFPSRCTLMGCTAPTAAHHHHMYHGHLNYRACTCGAGGYPGASGGVR